jgi:hypothetical protein
MASKDEIVARIQDVQGQIEQAVDAMPEQAWSTGVYEGGWNAKQVLAHMASMSGIASFVLNMANVQAAAAGGGLGANFDIDAFNSTQIAAREAKTPVELVGEIRSSFEKDISAVRAAPDDLIRKHYRAPWDVEGEVGDIIVGSLETHMGMHLADLRAAAR